MDEKTAELRDIFLDATGSETVTEDQETDRGSLTGRDDSTVSKRLSELIATMRDRYSFSTSLPEAAYERVVRAHFEGTDDATIAEDLATVPESSDGELDAERSISAEDVFRVRMDLHLVSDADREFPVDPDVLKRLVLAGTPTEELAAELEIDLETARRCRRIVEADVESTRANHRFRDEFRELLTDADLEGSLAADAQEDGLKEAAEDIETNVSF
ncbi:hypothetical protein ACERIT_00885 [Halopenitus sp. H-Gu1]|uniref:hypothetical protein n=1 Tax=Halopenitus sp. H-Gu1 TaxID=3242697 RepID=UPI00359D348B